MLFVDNIVSIDLAVIPAKEQVESVDIAVTGTDSHAVDVFARAMADDTEMPDNAQGLQGNGLEGKEENGWNEEKTCVNFHASEVRNCGNKCEEKLVSRGIDFNFTDKDRIVVESGRIELIATGEEPRHIEVSDSVAYSCGASETVGNNKEISDNFSFQSVYSKAVPRTKVAVFIDAPVVQAEKTFPVIPAVHSAPLDISSAEPENLQPLPMPKDSLSVEPPVVQVDNTMPAPGSGRSVYADVPVGQLEKHLSVSAPEHSVSVEPPVVQAENTMSVPGSLRSVYADVPGDQPEKHLSVSVPERSVPVEPPVVQVDNTMPAPGSLRSVYADVPGDQLEKHLSVSVPERSVPVEPPVVQAENSMPAIGSGRSENEGVSVVQLENLMWGASPEKLVSTEDGEEQISGIHVRTPENVDVSKGRPEKSSLPPSENAPLQERTGGMRVVSEISDSSKRQVAVKKRLSDDGNLSSDALVASGMVAPGHQPSNSAGEIVAAAQAGLRTSDVSERVQKTLNANKVFMRVAAVVAETILVSPSLLRTKEGNIEVQLKKETLEGSRLSISVTGMTMTVTFIPRTQDMSVFLEQNISRLEQHLTSHISSYQVVVKVKKQKS